MLDQMFLLAESSMEQIKEEELNCPPPKGQLMEWQIKQSKRMEEYYRSINY